MTDPVAEAIAELDADALLDNIPFAELAPDLRAAMRTVLLAAIRVSIATDSIDYLISLANTAQRLADDPRPHGMHRDFGVLAMRLRLSCIGRVSVPGRRPIPFETQEPPR